eukprot:jgi/Ulvmu1/12682/UM094_0039.1
MPPRVATAIGHFKATRPAWQPQPDKHGGRIRSPLCQSARADVDASGIPDNVWTAVPASQAPWQTSKREKSARSKDQTADQAPTELIFNLYNRGSGWGEEFIPHLTVQQRAVVKKPRRAWQEGSVEAQIAALGVDEDAVDDLVTSLVAWRVTKSGRPLVDKRRHRRVLRNVPLVTDFLVETCGIPRARAGVGALIQRYPMVLLCKPVNANDRFWRNAVALAAFAHQHGHCRVPEGPPEWRTLARFVARTRVLHAEGRLEPEKVDVLTNFQFDFASKEELPQAEWEAHFDALLEWLMCSSLARSAAGAGEAPLDPAQWQLMEWGARGTPDQRRLAAWVAQQRRLHACGTLSAAAVSRLEAIDFRFDDTDACADDREWLSELGGLMHVAARAEAASSAPSKRLKPAAHKRAAAKVAAAAAAAGDIVEDAEGEQAPRTPRDGLGTALGPESLQKLLGVGLSRDQWVWLQRQRVLWRLGRLPETRTRLLYAAGIDLDPYSSSEWRQLAHATSSLSSFEPVPLLSAAGSAEPVGASISAVRRWVLTQQRLAAEARLTRPQVEYLTAVGVCWLTVPAADAVVTQHDWEVMFRALADAVGVRCPAAVYATDEAAVPAPVVTYVDDLAAEPEHSVVAARGMGPGALLRRLSNAVRAHALEPAARDGPVLGVESRSRRAASVAALAVDDGAAAGAVDAVWGFSGAHAGGYAATAALAPVGLGGARGLPAVRGEGADSPRPGAGGHVRQASERGSAQRRSSSSGQSSGSTAGLRWSATVDSRRGGRRSGRRGRNGRWIAASSDSGQEGGGAAARRRSSAAGFGGGGYGGGADSTVVGESSAGAVELLTSGKWISSGGGSAQRAAKHDSDDERGNLVAETFGEVAKAARAARPAEQVLEAELLAAAASFVSALDATATGRAEVARMHVWTARRCASDARFRHAVLADWVQQQFALRTLGLQAGSRDAALRQVAAAARGDNVEREAGGMCCEAGDGAACCGGAGDHAKQEYEKLWCELSRQVREASLLRAGAAWPTRVAELIRYRRQHGTAEVPVLGEDGELATWIEGLKAHRQALRPSQVAQAWGLGLELRLPVAAGAQPGM